MSIGQKHKITLVERPRKIADDSATTESAIEHIIKLFNFSEQTIIFLLQPTSPLRQTNSLDKMFENLFFVGTKPHV